ncbi:hypothetical protein F511_33402 [Dorcoceras hygrometricum]|uniref:Uncharacterized protein n=1 Tax=Dorcoceras hygrometricum TaxID=472368 RepID=A0A2Z7BNR8_9LAMI|nr:hypothetical protein F511_33402 [Dorcoceras hygrometricum]
MLKRVYYISSNADVARSALALTWISDVGYCWFVLRLLVVFLVLSTGFVGGTRSCCCQLVALDSSREALSSYTIRGGCSWLERDREVAVSGRVFVREAVSSVPVSREIYALYVGCLAGFNQISRACIVVIVAQNQGTDLELEIQLGLAWDLMMRGRAAIPHSHLPPGIVSLHAPSC